MTTTQISTLPLSRILGIDIGSVSLSIAEIDLKREILKTSYRFHHGDIEGTLRESLSGFDLGRICGVAVTSSTPSMVRANRRYDNRVAMMEAARHFHQHIGSMLVVGGQAFGLIGFDENGRYRSFRTNTSCAAGTGSFLEEQARKLGCPLSQYSSRTEGRRSPIVSDRCTVFMERDMNHCLSEGYAVDEVLASVLHAVRENYLTKVAVEGGIGDTILFQGATAKNRSLVAAFEQRLKKPIHVSGYCHLTGALGAALALSDQGVRGSRFRGTAIHKDRIEVSSETCELCTNHCKISVADGGGERVATGFLCGRDYNTKRYVDRNLSGFDLLKERRKIFSYESVGECSEEITVGIP